MARVLIVLPTSFARALMVVGCPLFQDDTPGFGTYEIDTQFTAGLSPNAAHTTVSASCRVHVLLG